MSDERARFLARYGALYPAPWVAERAFAGGADDSDDVLSVLRRVIERAEPERRAEFPDDLAPLHRDAAERLAAVTGGPVDTEAVDTEAVDPDEAERLAVAALTAAGADAANAATIAASLVAAERDGAHSHGLFRLPGYVRGLGTGAVNGRAVAKRLEGTATVVRFDGDGGAAPRVYEMALKPLAESARSGVAVLAIRNVRHFAAMWPEVEALANEGLAALAATANLPYLAPHGGSRKLLGTNPLAFAYPRPGDPFVFDFATAAMARGDVMMAARDGRSVPLGVGLDADGAPTADPTRILEGCQLPFGGPKGSALAIMVELMAGGLVGDGFSDLATTDASNIPPGGIFLAAFAPDAIGGPGVREAAEAFLTRLEAEPGVRLPGARRHQNRAAGGPLHVATSLMATVRSLAGETAPTP